MRLLRGILGLLVIAVTVLVLAGVGQGSPGPATPLTAAQLAAARADLAALGPQGTTGQADFHSFGCDDCHTIAVSGYTGRLGPNLDGAFAAFPANVVGQQIRQFILHPPTNIPGFTPNLMPNNFSRRLTHDELADIVAYVSAASGHQVPSGSY